MNKEKVETILTSDLKIVYRIGKNYFKTQKEAESFLKMLKGGLKE